MRTTRVCVVGYIGAGLAQSIGTLWSQGNVGGIVHDRADFSIIHAVGLKELCTCGCVQL